ncbi:helix-turn-helix transcriptional regulator [Methylobacterium sp. SI9]|uniref:helix-turn-helix transcriptional regulator n=1 Tax=Methylobacterium guangdongense TaxID=3138811 RepID=UPI00313D17BB
MVPKREGLTCVQSKVDDAITAEDAWPRYGFVRLSQILAPSGPIPMSKSSWWQGVADGRFPQPIKLGPRTTVWRAEEIRAFIEAQSSRG